MSADENKDENGSVRAMDELNVVLMLFSGTTPEKVAKQREKGIEEEEERTAQELRQNKVME